MESVLTKNQKKQYGPRFIAGWGKNAQIKATVRYDDECGNGHNSFSITGEIYIPSRRDCEACGCLHEEIARVFPELAPFIKWHLTSSDAPMYYIENTLYWLGYCGWCDGKPDSPPKLEHARSTAVWPDMPESLLSSEPLSGDRIVRADSLKNERANEVRGILEARREGLMREFREAVESLGFVY
jgi:hypothetical protein